MYLKVDILKNHLGQICHHVDTIISPLCWGVWATPGHQRLAFMARRAAAGGDMLSYHFTRYQDIYTQTVVLQSQTERYGDTMGINSRVQWQKNKPICL